jgi:pyruvate kinase
MDTPSSAGGTGAAVRRAKILATLGPHTATPELVASLIEAGMDVARLNASHGTPEQRAALIATLREATERAGKPVPVMLDLQGPRIRIGELPRTIELEAGKEVIFAPEESAGPGEIPTTYAGLADDVKPGARILLNDGLLALTVTSVDYPRVKAEVVFGGPLTSHKGMNLPGISVSAPPLTVKDRADAAFARTHGVEYVALSFVRRAQDIAELRALLPPSVRICAKIEKDTALADAEAIAEASDAVMVARGDLGVELPFEEVPLVQKGLIRLAVAHRRPVIVATQMLDSMVHNPRPTRAEASDVANAVLDGADGLLLTGETAMGDYPRQAVEALDRIIREIERHPELAPRGADAADEGPVGVRTAHAVAAAACAAARISGAPLIVVFTKSGSTARVVAAARPCVPILGVTNDPVTWRQLALFWGVVPVLTGGPPEYGAMLEAARERILAVGLARKGDPVVVTAGVPFDRPGNTNLMMVEEV